MLAAGSGQPTHEDRLQSWRNACSERGESDPNPSRWLEGTQFIAKVGKKTRAQQSNSLRASASRINRERRAVFRSWFPLWKAEVVHLKVQLQVGTDWLVLEDE
jgi:hypothetical protein